MEGVKRPRKHERKSFPKKILGFPGQSSSAGRLRGASSLNARAGDNHEF